MVHIKSRVIKADFTVFEMNKKMKIYAIVTIFIVIMSLTGLTLLNLKTGLFQKENIDLRDMKNWKYEKGVISGAEEYRNYINNDSCWLMIHGYASTPADFSKLINQLNLQFNETIIAPRLKGHGTVPSEMLNLSFVDWYNQTEKEYLNLKDSCNSVNIVGFSFGGALALKISENYEVNNLYLISPFIKIRYKPVHVFPKEWFIKVFADYVGYSVKYSPAQINYKEGMKEYIGYYSFPLIPLKNSLDEIKEVERNIERVNVSGVLIAHSKNDDTVDSKSSEIIYNELLIDNKELIIYNMSNHVILVDYDSDDMINKIIEFEKNNR